MAFNFKNIPQLFEKKKDVIKKALAIAAPIGVVGVVALSMRKKRVTAEFENLTTEANAAIGMDQGIVSLCERLELFGHLSGENQQLVQTIVETFAQLCHLLSYVSQKTKIKVASKRLAGKYMSIIVESLRTLRSNTQHLLDASVKDEMMNDLDDIASLMNTLVEDYNHNIILAVDSNMMRFH
ncbi:MAG: hypothetical protein K0U52_13525 [Gammaproteobacteria bacterium]|nr:hypothetical protein [Gammaproteobacteria bacterium]